jgi:hypothetical protein
MKPTCSERAALGIAVLTARAVRRVILIAPHLFSQAKASRCTATSAF